MNALPETQDADALEEMADEAALDLLFADFRHESL